ncbi:MAG TPA: class I SAM-dependent methyltransferase [Dongiaceae bacterium]|nr:class I SAM-dependent methyltransferase [Dongiaceae bacterium]
MTTEQLVASHYTNGSLQQKIFDALKQMGKDPERLAASDLSAADELHTGWRAMTVEIGKDLGLQRGMTMLDVGSGIGGPARYFADAHGCQVTGIDLTEEFVQVAGELTRRCGLSDLVSFRRGSALDLPFSPGAFDAATLIHVGMNIEHKATLFQNVRRVLKPGGRFCVYDLMRMEAGDIPYPMPWAVTNETSFVETPDTYRRLLAAAGFKIEREENRRELVLKLAREMQEKIAARGAPPLSQQVLLGPALRERLSNLMGAVGRGILAPIEMIARAI